MEEETQQIQDDILESVSELSARLEELGRAIDELEALISESAEQLKYLKSGM